MSSEVKDPLETKNLVLDVKMVSETIVRIAKAKSIRSVRDSMTTTELKALADAALAGIKNVPVPAKPNGLTTEGRIIATLEADVAVAHVALQEAQAKIAELEEKIAAIEGGR